MSKDIEEIILSFIDSDWSIDKIAGYVVGKTGNFMSNNEILLAWRRISL